MSANSLNSEDEIAAYLNAVVEEDDPSLLQAAIGDVAKAGAMNEIPGRKRTRKNKLADDYCIPGSHSPSKPPPAKDIIEHQSQN